MHIKEYFKGWCEATGRSGGVLLGSSIQEFLDWYERKKNDHFTRLCLKYHYRYEGKYREWCRENPGKIMNGLAMMADRAKKVAFQCDNLNDVILMSAMCKQNSNMKGVNGWLFSYNACEEIIKGLREMDLD